MRPSQRPVLAPPGDPAGPSGSASHTFKHQIEACSRSRIRTCGVRIALRRIIMRRQVVPIVNAGDVHHFHPAWPRTSPSTSRQTSVGDYFIVEKTGPENRPVVVVKQVATGHTTTSSSGSSIATPSDSGIWGKARALAAMTASEPESAPDMEDIRPGSISDKIAEYVCPQPEPEPDAEPRAPAQSGARP